MIGIIILNYETWEATLLCIKSIFVSDIREKYQIYLIDNASLSEMPVEISNYINEKKIVFIKAKKNRGYSAGNNIGIRKALEDNCKAILITNNDIIFQDCAIQELYKFLNVNKDIGIAGPKVIGSDGKSQLSAISRKTGIKEIFQIYTVGKMFFRKSWKSYFSLDKNREEDFSAYHVSGCCFMMSRDCAEKITPLDEGVFLYNEELILGIIMEKLGLQTWYHPKSIVEHHHGFTTKKMKPIMYQCIGISEIYYCFSYLNAKIWKVWILYKYRLILYWIRSRRNVEMKNYWKDMKREMQNKWIEYKKIYNEKNKRMK